MLYVEDFNIVAINDNVHFVRIEELNKMIEYDAITINREKLEEYKRKTRYYTWNKTVK